MSIFDCVDQSCLPGKPDQEVIDLGRKIDRILNEIKLFTQEAMSKFLGTIEASIALQETALNNSLAYIRNIIDIQTSNISNILTVNRESVSNLVSQILTELIIQLNVNGLPVGTEIELSRPVVIENYYGGSVSNVNVENLYSGTTPQVQPSISAQLGGNLSNGGTYEISGQSTGSGPARTIPQANKGSGGHSPQVSTVNNECKPGTILNLVFADGGQFYCLISGSVSSGGQVSGTILGQVGSVNGENNLALVNNLLGQSANLPPESLPEYIANQVIPQLAPVVPPLVQSPTGSLLPVGVSNPVNIEQPEAFRFQQRGQPWFREAIAWAGKDFTDYQNSLTFREYFNGVFGEIAKEWIQDEK